jgi:hypothetical protein
MACGRYGMVHNANCYIWYHTCSGLRDDEIGFLPCGLCGTANRFSGFKEGLLTLNNSMLEKDLV